MIWGRSRVLINKSLPCIERLRCLWLSAMPLIIPVKRDQFCFRVEKIKENRMPSIFASFGYLASGKCFLISSERCLLLDRIVVFFLLIRRLAWEEKSWMSYSAGFTSDGSVRKSMVSSAYCCNFIDAEPKKRPLIEDEELIFLDKTSVAMENGSIRSGQPCRMPVVTGMRSVRVWLTNILADISCKRIVVHWIKAGGRLIRRMRDKINLWETLSNALAKSSWSKAIGWLMIFT